LAGVDTAAVIKLQPSKYELAKPCVNQDVTNVVPVNQRQDKLLEIKIENIIFFV
jgi:hypothetical protein